MKDKKFQIISFIYLLFGLFSFGQNNTFRVIHVSGKITYGPDKELLKPGLKFNEYPIIYFSSPNDNAIFWSAGTREIYVTPNYDKKTASPKLWVALKKVFEANVKDIKSRGEWDSSKYLIISKGKLLEQKEIKVFKVPEDNVNSYYFVEGTLEVGTKKKQLQVGTNKIIQIKEEIEELYQMGALTFKIGFFDKKMDEATYFKSLVYTAIEFEKIKREVKMLKNWYKNLDFSKEETNSHIKEFLLNTYGNQMSLDALVL